MSVICNNVHQSTNLRDVCNVHGLEKVKKHMALFVIVNILQIVLPIIRMYFIIPIQYSL